MRYGPLTRPRPHANTNDVVFGQEIRVKDGVIACIGSNLPSSPSTTVIDAKGGYITPGGDSDTWETGTRSAVCGRTTTVLAFAVQQKADKSIVSLVNDYSTRAGGNAACDYGFHIIFVKLYMTYEAMKVDDRGILDVLIATRKLGITTMIHAENHDMVSLITETLERDGQTDPYFHAVSRPKIAEDEASYRAIALSKLMDAPILLVHVSSETTASHIRHAQSQLLPVYGETCPQFNASGGKRLGLVNGIPKFGKIPNGLPGLETRQRLLFKGVLEGKITIQDFVRVSCTNPDQLYGLPSKGVIFPGKDADLCIWYPKGEMQPLQLTNAMLHHNIDYSPFEGMTFYNWPRYTILRGKVV
ncbi:hypothetical protein ASPVEDRAFT_51921 [Aspergillus versicolor CBS 583.65]|uniref:dihydropyrimidinase n=1 Tax=Aspergillus versicolor CBS 583.65 TaxID=1036611 RepID=A0A1L9PHC0_ASPVE|nr:uncharacterized protein ASPVEDRAFT_51921 [Aspergillus versicolor CBS 583.65]OJJ00856.1 hypothetical protein ASPVEDRAFT_51921 [Aspergillus versicolor CBS 583.65]